MTEGCNQTEDRRLDQIMERLDRVETLMLRLIEKWAADRNALVYLDAKADQTAHDHWDLVDSLTPVDVEPAPLEPASRPLSAALPVAS